MGASFAKFMATGLGRLIRIGLGFALIVAGQFVVGPAGVVLTLVGLVPMFAGLFNVCLISPLLHAPFFGDEALKPKA